MKIKIAYALTAVAALFTLGSCSEGKYWNEPDSYGDVVAFAKSRVNVVLAPEDEVPSSYDVTLYRTDATSEETYNVVLATKYPDVITGPATVTFPAGSTTAKYTLSIADMLPGVQYTATVAIDQEEGALHVAADNSSFTFRILQNLVWSEAGTANVTSYVWVVDGDDNPVSVNGVEVQEAEWPVANERLFRLVDVYYALEPGVAKKGGSIAFFTDDEGNALRMYDEWQYIGESIEDEYVMFGCPAQYGASFTSEGNVYIMDGIMGLTTDLYGDVTPSYYETLGFIWSCPPAK